ncbi:hypothetical protein GCK32_018838 [Trichostrongylus colubriformis]|uniref:Cortactin-binding protein-2 N-terminal domain-containing protein n=1 Tax=Trichostrongylus colubriformis TaxID=6319 RepID=A0AAN8EWY5_TRICO
MNLGFNFDGEYHLVTSKHMPTYQNSEIISDPDDFTREELLKLLSYFEGELQARDEVVARLRLEIQINEVAESKAETERVERKLEAERERHKSMVLFLINERKQMLVKMHELRVKSEANALMTPGDLALLEELKKEVGFLREERDSLKNANKSLKHLPQLTDTGGSLVVANRMATSAGSSSGGSSSTGPAMSAGTLSSRTRLATSSSFPAEKSRLPRAPSSPARGLPSPR